MPNCGEALVSMLQAYGVDTVFGIPGNHTVELYRGLSASGIRHVTPRHEQGAAFMADGYARASGRPGVCFLISGPGLTNAATGMMQALADSIPMLVITAVAARRDLGMGEGHLHELPDQRALASQCSRFSHTLMDPRELPRILARAFAVMQGERPGPVHIELPLDVITADACDVDTRPWPIPSRPGPDPHQVAKAAVRLMEAETPLIILGGGAIAAGNAVAAVAERLDAPVLNTVNAKGVLPMSHALAVGGSPSLSCMREVMTAADVILAVGTEFGETDYDMLFVGDLQLTGDLIRVDIDASQLTRNQRPWLAIQSDATLFLETLLAGLEVRPAANGLLRANSMRDAVRQEKHFHPEFQSLFETLRTTLPEILLVGDSTLPTYYAVWQYECEQPRRYFHSATGGGTLGYAIPAAFGARLARPDLPVVAVIGDGSVQFTLAELAAGVEAELPVAIIVWNNQGYSEIKQGMLASGIEPQGVDIFTPDLVAAAKALGCHTASPSTLDALSSALLEAVGHCRPTLIELRQEDFLTLPAGQWY